MTPMFNPDERGSVTAWLSEIDNKACKRCDIFCLT